MVAIEYSTGYLPSNQEASNDVIDSMLDELLSDDDAEVETWETGDGRVVTKITNDHLQVIEID